MSISPFFQNLRTSYQAELDDLYSDSEGHNVLAKRLAEKRQEIDFLVQMMQSSPEMVAVVLHQAFEFSAPELMAHALTRDADELLTWPALEQDIRLAPWAHSVATKILAQSEGEWFMGLVPALEYMHGTPLRGSAHDTAEGHDADADEELENVERGDLHEQDEEREARDREEAGNAWMVEQGFDSKE